MWCNIQVDKDIECFMSFVNRGEYLCFNISKYFFYPKSSLLQKSDVLLTREFETFSEKSL